MGLDAYIYATPIVPSKQVDFNDEVYPETDDEFNGTELGYWRKCYPLHNWMEELYYAKGGEGKSFNCVPVQLTVFELERLLEDCEGFDTTEWEIEKIKEVAREAASHIILTGETVFYDSWW